MIDISRLPASVRSVLVAALMIPGLAAPVLAGPIFFAPHLLFETGHTPTSVAIADLNGDGHPDLAATNSAAYYSDTICTVSVLLGNGDGTFGARTDFVVGGRTLPQSVAVADLDGDGRPDLAVANYGLFPDYSAGTVAVLLGNGDGTFRTRTEFPAGPKLRSVRIADLDEDGDADLITEKSVLLGNGDGTFAPKTDLGTWSDWSVAVADLNGDGWLDLATTNGYVEPDNEEGMQAVSVRLGNGDGTFGAATGFGTGHNAYSVAIADLDGDARPDLAVANFGSSQDDQGSVSVLRGNGDGTFGLQRYFAAGINPMSLVIADLDEDGRPDIATTNYGADPDYESNTVSVLLGNGDGTFHATPEFPVGQNPRSLASADLDGDGLPDLVTADDGSNTVSVLLGNGDGSFGAPSFDTGDRPIAVAIADLDADGWQDLAVANTSWAHAGLAGSASVLLGNGDGTFGTRTDFGAGTSPSAIAISDLDVDGWPDLAVANFGSYPDFTGTISVLRGNGDGTFQNKVDYAAGSNPSSMAIADLDVDGRPDLAVANTNANTVSVLLGNGDGSLGARAAFGTGGTPGSLAIADLDADGRPDLVTANSSSPNTVSVLLGNGDGTFRAKTDFATGGLGNNSHSVAIADLDADGRLDLVAGGSVLLGNGDGTFGAWTPLGTAGGVPEVEALAIGDFDADGRQDLAAVCSVWGADAISVQFGNGDGTFGTRALFGAERSPRSLVTTDLDTDGRPDLAVVNLSSNTVSVLLNRSAPDGTTPTLASLESAVVREGSARLAWHAPNGFSARLDRSTGREWRRLASLASDEAGRITYEDRDLEPGKRHGYRLAISSGQSETYLGEVWVDVPGLALSLEGTVPNPATTHTLWVRFTLPTADAATLELFDLAGRRLISSPVGPLGLGSHRVKLDPVAELPSGIYLLRLSQGALTLTSKAVVIP